MFRLFNFRDRAVGLMKCVPTHLRSHDENRMIQLLIGVGLRYSEKTTVLGAQTVRRGDARPVRDLLGGWTSPALVLLNTPPGGG
jgi:hypothetical protein